MSKLSLPLFLITLVYSSFASASATNACKSILNENSKIAKANTACVCQIGTRKGQKPWFRLGCKKWLKQQNKCGTKEIVDSQDEIAKVHQKNQNIKLIKVGYVGHWSNAYDTVEWLESSMLPLTKSHGVKFEVDNTACLPMSSPGYVQKFLDEQTEKGEFFVTGAQAVSTGLWDQAMLAKRTNFPATACKGAIDYPSCHSFEDKGCIAYQNDAVATCRDHRGKLQRLRCQMQVETVRHSRVNGKRIGAGSKEKTTLSWQHSSDLEPGEITVAKVEPNPDAESWEATVGMEFHEQIEEDLRRIKLGINDAIDPSTLPTVFRVSFENPKLHSRHFDTLEEAQAYAENYNLEDNFHNLDETERDYYHWAYSK